MEPLHELVPLPGSLHIFSPKNKLVIGKLKPVTGEATLFQRSEKLALGYSGLGSTSDPHHPKTYNSYPPVLGHVCCFIVYFPKF